MRQAGREKICFCIWSMRRDHYHSLAGKNISLTSDGTRGMHGIQYRSLLFHWNQSMRRNRFNVSLFRWNWSMRRIQSYPLRVLRWNRIMRTKPVLFTHVLADFEYAQKSIFSSCSGETRACVETNSTYSIEFLSNRSMRRNKSFCTGGTGACAERRGWCASRSGCSGWSSAWCSWTPACWLRSTTTSRPGSTSSRQVHQ